MDDIEVPIEAVQEEIHHHATHGGNSRMNNLAALLSAFLAVAAAVSALLAGHYANDAMIEQIQSSDQWSLYQAKGIKLAIAEMRAESSTVHAEVEGKIAKYKKDQEKIGDLAKEKETESKFHLKRHENLAASVTFFQVAIAMTAIAVLTRKKTFLGLAGGLGGFGVLWTLFSLLSLK